MNHRRLSTRIRLIGRHLLWLAVLVAGAGCRLGQTLSVDALPNYKPDQPAILFLDFSFQNTDRPDQPLVTLVNAIAGRGTMKDLPVFSDSHRQIEVVYVGSGNEIIRATRYDHPLYRIVEYPADDQTLRLRGISLTKSTLSIRFPYRPEIARLDLFTIQNERRKKIYSLRLHS